MCIIEILSSFFICINLEGLHDGDIIDLKGKTLLPGFIDSHTHPVISAFLYDMVDLSGFTHNSKKIFGIIFLIKYHSTSLESGFYVRVLTKFSYQIFYPQKSVF